MDFRTYVNENKEAKNAGDTQNDAKNANQSNDSQGKMNERDIRRAINYFSKMPTDELMKELSHQIALQKAQGREGNIKNTLERIRPMLNPEQRARLDEVMSQVTTQ